jgi:hypothetical protein
MIFLDAENSLCTLLVCQEVGMDRTVGEEEIDADAKNDCENTSDHCMMEVSYILETRISVTANVPINHFQGEKLPVSIQSTP